MGHSHHHHVGCGCSSPAPTKKETCVRVCEPIQVMQGEDWVLAKAPGWTPVTVSIPANGAGMLMFPVNAKRKETIVRVTSATGWVYVGPTKEAVEAGKGHPMLCNEMFVQEGYTGEIWVASESGKAAEINVNEIYCA